MHRPPGAQEGRRPLAASHAPSGAHPSEWQGPRQLLHRGCLGAGQVFMGKCTCTCMCQIRTCISTQLSTHVCVQQKQTQTSTCILYTYACDRLYPMCCVNPTISTSPCCTTAEIVYVCVMDIIRSIITPSHSPSYM